MAVRQRRRGAARDQSHGAVYLVALRQGKSTSRDPTAGVTAIVDVDIFRRTLGDQ